MYTTDELISKFKKAIEKLAQTNNEIVTEMHTINQFTNDPELQHNTRIIINTILEAYNFQSKAAEIIRLTKANRFELLTSKK